MRNNSTWLPPTPLTELIFGGKGNPVPFRARMYKIHVVIIIFGLRSPLLLSSLLPLKLPENPLEQGGHSGKCTSDWLADDDVTMTSFNLQGQSGDERKRSGSVCLSDGQSSELESGGGGVRIRYRRCEQEDTRERSPESRR